MFRYPVIGFFLLGVLLDVPSALASSSGESTTFASCPADSAIQSAGVTSIRTFIFQASAISNSSADIHLTLQLYFSPSFDVKTLALTAHQTTAVNLTANVGMELTQAVPNMAGMWRLLSFTSNSSGVQSTAASCTFNFNFLPSSITFTPPTGSLLEPGSVVQVSYAEESYTSQVVADAENNCTMTGTVNSIVQQPRFIQSASAQAYSFASSVGLHTLAISVQCSVGPLKAISLVAKYSSSYVVPEKLPSPKPSVDSGPFVSSLEFTLVPSRPIPDSTLTNRTAVVFYYYLSQGSEGAMASDDQWIPYVPSYVSKDPSPTIRIAQSTVIGMKSVGLAGSGYRSSEIATATYTLQTGAAWWEYTLGIVFIVVGMFFYLLYLMACLIAGRSLSKTMDLVCPLASCVSELVSFATDIPFVVLCLFVGDATIGETYGLAYIFIMMFAGLLLLHRSCWLKEHEKDESNRILFFIPGVNVYAVIAASQEELVAVEEDRMVWAGLQRLIHDLGCLIVVCIWSTEFPYRTNTASVFKLFWCIANISFSCHSVAYTLWKGPQILYKSCDEDEEAKERERLAAEQIQNVLSGSFVASGNAAVATDAESSATLRSKSTQPTVTFTGVPPEQDVDGTKTPILRSNTPYENVGIGSPGPHQPLSSREEKDVLHDVFVATEISLLRQLKGTKPTKDQLESLQRQLDLLQQDSEKLQVLDEGVPAEPSPEAVQLLQVSDPFDVPVKTHPNRGAGQPFRSGSTSSSAMGSTLTMSPAQPHMHPSNIHHPHHHQWRLQQQRMHQHGALRSQSQLSQVSGGQPPSNLVTPDQTPLNHSLHIPPSVLPPQEVHAQPTVKNESHGQIEHKLTGGPKLVHSPSTEALVGQERRDDVNYQRAPDVQVVAEGQTADSAQETDASAPSLSEARADNPNPEKPAEGAAPSTSEPVLLPASLAASVDQQQGPTVKVGAAPSNPTSPIRVSNVNTLNTSSPQKRGPPPPSFQNAPVSPTSTVGAASIVTPPSPAMGPPRRPTSPQKQNQPVGDGVGPKSPQTKPLSPQKAATSLGTGVKQQVRPPQEAQQGKAPPAQFHFPGPHHHHHQHQHQHQQSQAAHVRHATYQGPNQQHGNDQQQHQHHHQHQHLQASAVHNRSASQKPMPSADPFASGPPRVPSDGPQKRSSTIPPSRQSTDRPIQREVTQPPVSQRPQSPNLHSAPNSAPDRAGRKVRPNLDPLHFRVESQPIPVNPQLHGAPGVRSPQQPKSTVAASGSGNQASTGSVVRSGSDVAPPSPSTTTANTSMLTEADPFALDSSVVVHSSVNAPNAPSFLEGSASFPPQSPIKVDTPARGSNLMNHGDPNATSNSSVGVASPGMSDML